MEDLTLHGRALHSREASPMSPVLFVDQGPVRSGPAADDRDGGEPAEAGGFGLAGARLLHPVPATADRHHPDPLPALRRSLNLLVDSTGVTRLGEGKWQVRRHGASRRRQWRKVHLALDTATGDVRAVEFSREGDSPVLPGLLAQIPPDQPVGTVTADGTVRNPVREALLLHDREAFAEHDGELGLRLEPFPRRPFPVVVGAVQDEV